MRRSKAEEAALATYYEQHREDDEEWGEPVESPPVTSRRGLTATITIRFSPDEASAIRQAAKSSGLTYSEVVRQAVRAFTRPRIVVRFPGSTMLPEQAARLLRDQQQHPRLLRDAI
jgi:hypothetical protein